MSYDKNNEGTAYVYKDLMDDPLGLATPLMYF